MSTGSPFDISFAVTDHLHLNLSKVLKLQGLTKCNCSAGEDNETCDKSEYYETVGSKSVNSHASLQLTDNKLIP